MNKISVIVPVYNVELYLYDCIESLLNQTYKNIEIILVDDGSTDKCPQICDKYALKDSRIKVLHKENGGLSDARNGGLKAATGSYIAFVDSDDIIASNMLDELFQIAKNYSADIVECDFIRFENLKECTGILDASVSNVVSSFSAESAIENLMMGQLRQVVWNKLYSNQVIGDLKFKKGRINEDEFWTYKVFGNANKIVKISGKLYFYRQQANSIMGSGYNIRRLDALDALEERIYYISQKFPKLLSLALKSFCFSSIYQYQMIKLNPSVDPGNKYCNKISGNVKKHVSRDLFNSLTLKEKIWLQFFITLPEFAGRLRNYLKIGF